MRNTWDPKETNQTESKIVGFCRWKASNHASPPNLIIYFGINPNYPPTLAYNKNM